MKCDICEGTVPKDDVVISWSELKDESGAALLDDISVSHKDCYERAPGEFNTVTQCDADKEGSKTAEEVGIYLSEFYKARSEKAELKWGQILDFLFDLKPRKILRD